LRSIVERGGEIIISGDCHAAEALGLGFDRAIQAAKEAGFTRAVFFTADGKQFIEI
jgi:histidinol phosphatase-like PHP family hydrolase